MDIYKTPAQIHEQLKMLAKAINHHYTPVLSPNTPLHVVGLLSGAFMFMADLARLLTVPCELHFIRVSSYGAGRQSSGHPEIDCLGLTPQNLSGQHVLLLDDILDTGQSLQTVTKALAADPAYCPLSIELAVLIDKPGGRVLSILPADLKPRFVGFTLDGADAERFVVGYGLDDAGRYRELPYLGLL